MEMSQTITKIAPALLKAQGEMGAAVKDAKNPFFKSSYADLNAIREASLPALQKHGIVVLQPTVVVEGRNYVKTVLLHESGEYLASLTQIKTVKENDPQAEGSGISYARRYALQSFLNIGAVDDDGEKGMARETKPTTQQTPTPQVTNGTMASGTLNSKPTFRRGATKPAVGSSTPPSNGSDWS